MNSPDKKLFFYRTPSDMTPFLPTHDEAVLREKAALIIKLSGKLSTVLPSNVQKAVSSLIEPMNSYYSNLIEGNKTHPLDIEKALNKKYSKDPDKRKLQLENTSHIHVHRKLKNNPKLSEIEITGIDFLSMLHHDFYEKLPPEMRKIISLEGKEFEIVPGQLRKTEVKVGAHIAPHSDSLLLFLNLFSERYRIDKIHDPLTKIIAIAASHHRLAWIHPFSDGNGRVVRLFSEAYSICLNIDANSLWCISRGLARNKTQYYSRLANADLHRRNDYDGRGNLSDRYLSEFCSFFLDIIIDQIVFMLEILDLEKLDLRMKRMCELLSAGGEIDKTAYFILSEALYKGKVIKGDLERLTGKSENTARAITTDLIKRGLLKNESNSLRSPLLISFPVRYAPHLFPKLYPADAEMEMG